MSASLSQRKNWTSLSNSDGGSRAGPGLQRLWAAPRADSVRRPTQSRRDCRGLQTVRRSGLLLHRRGLEVAPRVGRTFRAALRTTQVSIATAVAPPCWMPSNAAGRQSGSRSERVELGNALIGIAGRSIVQLARIAILFDSPSTKRHMSELNPDHILQVGLGFWPSKALLSAVEMELFTELAKHPEDWGLCKAA